MRYVDCYLLAVPKNKLKEYQKIAKKAGQIWKKYGALEYMECAGDDLTSEWSTLTFPQMVQAKPGETVIFSFVVFTSRKHRDEVNAKVFKDPYMSPENQKDKEMPFDMKRMAYGGFEGIVDE